MLMKTRYCSKTDFTIREFRIANKAKAKRFPNIRMPINAFIIKTPNQVDPKKNTVMERL